MKNLYLLLSCLSLVAITCEASNDTKGIDIQQEKQIIRIKQGIDNGQLTRREARNALKGQRQLAKMKRKAKSDGVVTKKERARLNKKVRIESRKIFLNKHDR